MTRIYEKNEQGQDIVRSTVHEQDESGKWIDRECIVLVDSLMQWGDKIVTHRQFYEAVDRPDAMVENIQTGERMLKSKWLEMNRVKRETEI